MLASKFSPRNFSWVFRKQYLAVLLQIKRVNIYLKISQKSSYRYFFINYTSIFLNNFHLSLNRISVQYVCILGLLHSAIKESSRSWYWIFCDSSRCRYWDFWRSFFLNLCKISSGTPAVFFFLEFLKEFLVSSCIFLGLFSVITLLLLTSEIPVGVHSKLLSRSFSRYSV